MKKRPAVRFLKHQDLKIWAGQERGQGHLVLTTELIDHTSILKGDDPGPGDSAWVITVNPSG